MSDLPSVEECVSIAREWLQGAAYTPRGQNRGEDLLLKHIRYLRTALTLDRADHRVFELIFLDFNGKLSENDKWTEKEVRHKLPSVQSEKSTMPYGCGLKHFTSGIKGGPTISPFVVGSGDGSLDRGKWSDPLPLPDPIAITPIGFLQELFNPGEYVHIRPKTRGDDGEMHFQSGLTMLLEDWIKLAKQEGSLEKCLTTADECELFVIPNPVKKGGTKDSDVADFRMTVLEFDEWELERQHGILLNSDCPGTHIIHTAGRSLHQLVPLMADNEREFARRRAFLDEYLAVFKPDTKCKNPSRMTRIPGTRRGDKQITLIAHAVGTNSWYDWEKAKSLELCGRLMTVDDLLHFDISDDAGNLLGNRWIERGTAGMLFGPTGIGKSVMAMGMAGRWALGRSFFGIRPKRPLKVGIVQAENTEADMAEAFKAMVDGLRDEAHIEAGSPEDIEMLALLKENFHMLRNDSDTGEKFCERLHKFIEAFDKDLVFADPYMAYSGSDVNDQEKTSRFLRNTLNPMLAATRCALIFVHHIGKPKGDNKTTPTIYQMAYAGLGSSELMNWPRAIMVLEPLTDDIFRLVFSKRGKRSGATNTLGLRTVELFLRHSKDPSKPWWEQISDEEGERAKASRRQSEKANSSKTDDVPWNAHWDNFIYEYWDTNDNKSRQSLNLSIREFLKKTLGMDRGERSIDRMIYTLCHTFKFIEESDHVKGQGKAKYYQKTGKTPELPLDPEPDTTPEPQESNADLDSNNPF